LGQIPNAVLKFSRKIPQVDYKSIDSSLWFIIGHYVYRSRYKDGSLFRRHESSIKKAFRWIRYRDFSSNVALEQLPTTDWQDAFPHKYGMVISTQALYYKVLGLMNQNKLLKALRKEVNKSRDNRLWNKTFYWAYRWKNHNKYKEIGEWFDSFGNMMAIVYGLATPRMGKKILSYVKRHKIDRPYPMKCIAPPIDKKSEYWQDYYLDAGATPNHYLNGSIWPYIGGLYVLALVKYRMMKEARRELELLAGSNVKGNLFPEWIDPKDKKTYGRLQAWSAGTYMWAYNSLKEGRVL
jgi:glycogen debranching enzyme